MPMAWRIPETDIERVKRQTDLLALVQSRGIELKRHGSKDWIGRCPFHPDKDKPNFIVTPGKGLGRCTPASVFPYSLCLSTKVCRKSLAPTDRCTIKDSGLKCPFTVETPNR
jgi:hypothetical protein